MKKPLTGAEINELVAGINKLSRNLWWTWNQEAQDLFFQLSPRGWQNLFHNAVAVLRAAFGLHMHGLPASGRAPAPGSVVAVMGARARAGAAAKGVVLPPAE